MSAGQDQPWWTYSIFRVQANTKSEARALMKRKYGGRLPKHAKVVRERPQSS